ncbi:MAG TPA: UDP-N-acetylglucosamine 1-carboxyvinyltransferase [Thermodesulfovibrionales bacterium]|nr:UDP-N-acetylglucosamine 1-carboxyvinyltransferase [Thermodesulfovibrionales bacterium]
MDKLVIQGRKRLKGEVKISGAKNAALPVMVASLLASGENVVNRVPNLADVKTMGKLLVNLGAGFRYEPGRAVINTEKLVGYTAPYDLVKTMRASVLVIGPLLARTGMAKVSLPGGCAIGARPINLHLMGLKKMGAEIDLEEGYVIARCKRLRGDVIYFDIPTVTGTENIMMAASLAEGTTILENAAKEPEVVDLANALSAMGAKIRGAGESIIEIKGVNGLRPLSHTIIPDRVETGTFMTIAGMTGGDLLIKDCRPDHNDALITKLRESGVIIETMENNTALRAFGPDRPSARDIKTMPYPGFPTDMQAQFMTLMSISNGTSTIRETIFENRFMHVAEIKRMGADISIEGGIATVRGVTKLKGADVMATDLRASASLIVAGLGAEGKTTIHRLYHLDRGYERIEEKLRAIGAVVDRQRDVL